LETTKLTLSPSPHVKSDDTTSSIMFGVVIAMMPAMIVSFAFFGLGAIKVTLFSILFCMVFEYLIQKLLFKGECTLTDGSAVVTGMLLAFNLPSNFPIWMIIVGSFVAISMGKMTFGGLGNNPFNPALVGRVFLLISFPVEMTSWPIPVLLDFSTSSLDGVTAATALGVMKEGITAGNSLSDLFNQLPSFCNMFLGKMGGSIGEISGIALIIGGLYMLWRKIITWHIPVSFIASVAIIAGVSSLISPSSNPGVMFHLLSGGLLLGAIFMATDMVTSPMSPMGQIIFGIGCGLITILVRMFGAYPEGVSFAILIMNAFTPIINMLCKPKRFGVK
jgi:Na+-translocating ferredoxin:NAD+ oxidoreductase subunit D